MTAGPWLAGVDGCRSGWVAAFVRPTGGDARVRVVPRFADVLGAPEAPTIVAVDIPIGLPQPNLWDGAGQAKVDAAHKKYANVPQRNYQPFVDRSSQVKVKVEPPNGELSPCPATSDCASVPSSIPRE